MRSAAALDLRAPRHVPFVYSIMFDGLNFAGATFRAQVRLYRDAAGSALIDLTAAAPTAQGVSFTVDTAAPSTMLQLRIDQATLEGLPAPGTTGGDLELAWDLIITPAGGGKEQWLKGSFVVESMVVR